MGLRVCGPWTYAVPSHGIQAIVAKGLTQKRTNNIKPDDREGRVDYVAKTDSDTLINPALLLDFVERDLPSAPNNRRTYGGKTWANFKRSSVYMAGQFYFLSTDLARFVTRTLTADDRRALGGGARTALEDVDMGSYVFSHPRPIKLVSVAGSMFWWHPVRDEGSWGDLWKYRDATSPYHTPEMPYKELCEHWQGHSLLSEETYGALN